MQTPNMVFSLVAPVPGDSPPPEFRTTFLLAFWEGWSSVLCFGWH